MASDQGEILPKIDRKLLEEPGNQTAESLLEALLVWGTQTELPRTKPGELPYMVSAFDRMYRGGTVALVPMTDEETEEAGPFMMCHCIDQEKEKTVIQIYLHPGTIIEAINFSSETEIEAVLKGFVKLVSDVLARYKLLREKGARFLYH